MKRRTALKQAALAAAGTATLGFGCHPQISTPQNMPNNSSVNMPMSSSLKGNINHSVARWCFGDIPLEEFLDIIKDMGITGIDLLKPDEWKLATDRGLTVAIATDNISLTQGFNQKKYHELLQAEYPSLIQSAAAAGCPNVICFSGNREGISEAEGLENCAIGLAPLVKIAEKEGITLIMELFNSKIDHPDYQCDSTRWGIDLVQKIGSPRFKLLYDIYHMQIMEGDVIRTIRDHHENFAHYHTAGVPGRNEIDETQELYYPAIMKAIAETGYTGFVAQEFMPKQEDKLGSLRKAIAICDV